MMRSSKSFAPHVVGTPFVENRSFRPYGTPCSGPRYLPGRDLGVGLRGFGARRVVHEGDDAIERRIEPLEPLEVDVRDARRREFARLDERGDAVRRQEREVFVRRRHRPAELLHREHGAIEGRPSALARQLLHQRAGAAGIRLELQGRRLAVAEREGRDGRRLEAGRGASRPTAPSRRATAPVPPSRARPRRRTCSPPPQRASRT